MAAHDWGHKGGAWPEPIRTLEPIEVYIDRGNVVIALYRDAKEERGVYVLMGNLFMPSENDKEWKWSWSSQDREDIFSYEIYKYSRTR